MADFITFKPFVPRTTNIVNPTDQPGKPLFLDVPITSNHHNRKRFVSDWELRTFYEHKNAKSEFFVTLTFDDAHVPKMEDGTLCFRPDYVTNFLKRFRNYLIRDAKFPVNSFRYFLCSEYGKNTHRPHHHALFFFDFPISFPFVLNAVKRAWYYGFSLVEIPESNRVLTYVSKYVAKDMFSMDLSASKDDEDITQERRVYNFVTKEYDTYTVTRYNFHRQSLGYGKSMLNDLTETDLKEGVKFVFMGGPIARPFAIPKYAADKLLRERVYYYDKYDHRHSRTFNSELGDKVHKFRIEKLAKSLLEEAEKLQNQRYVYLENFGIDIQFEDVDFKLAYQDNFKHISEDVFTDFYDYLLNKRFRPIDNRDHVPLSKKEKRNCPLWNSQYEGYERILAYIRDVHFILDCHSQRADEVKEFNNLIKKRRYGRSY